MPGNRPTHFPGGVSNVEQPHPLFFYGMVNPFAYHTWADDFDNFTAANWVITETQAGATQGIAADSDGGVLALVNSAADNDVNSIQWAGGAGAVRETFRWESTKDMFIYARFKVSDATQSDLAIGLMITDTSPEDTTDGIFFFKADGSTTLTMRVEKDNTASTANIATLANDTYVVVGISYTASDASFRGWLQNSDGTFTQTAAVATTNAPNDEDLAVTIAVQNGEAAAKTLSVDYLLVAKKR